MFKKLMMTFIHCSAALKFGERCFSRAGPKAWNSVPHAFQEITDSNISSVNCKHFCLNMRSLSTLWQVLAAGHLGVSVRHWQLEYEFEFDFEFEFEFEFEFALKWTDVYAAGTFRSRN